MQILHLESRNDKNLKNGTTCDWQKFFSVFKKLINKKNYDIQHYTIVEEISKKVKKVHYHYYWKLVSKISLNSQKDISYESLHRFLKRNLVKTVGFTSSEYHIGKVKNVSKYLVYILKDFDVKKNTVPDSDFQSYLKETKRVNQEKNKKMKHLLFDESLTYVENWSNGISKHEIYKMIDLFHVERDYLPPSFSLRTQYARYIILKYPFINDIIQNEVYKLWI